MMSYRDGDAGAFETLYRRHRGGLYRYFLRQCGNAALAEELFQDVWLKLIAARQSYTSSAKFTTYIYHIAHNRLIDHYRQTSRHTVLRYGEDAAEEMEMVPGPVQDEPDYQLNRRQLSERLMALVAELPAPQREAFLLREESGLSLDEMAEVTGVNRETAKSRLRYAVAKLRAGLGGVL